MKTRKVLALLLTAALLLTLLAACSTSPSTSPTPTPTPTPTPSTPADNTDEPSEEPDDGLWHGDVSKVIMTYLTVGTVPADVLMVQDAVNEITIPRIGVEVEFKVISIVEARAQYTTWIATKEPMDVMLLAFTNVSPYIDQGMLMPLNDLIEANAPHIYQLGQEYPIYDAAISGGQNYGISTVKAGYGGGGSYLIKQSALDAAGLSYKNDDKVTLDDLTNIFAAVKAALPDVYPCGLTGKNIPYGFTMIADALGASIDSGVLMGTESTTVVNLFESDEFKSYLSHVRDWYTSGYIVRDAATTDMSHLDYLMAGTTVGYFADGPEYLRTAAELSTQESFVQLQLIDAYRPSISGAGNVYWSLPVTCANPEGAMRFLDLMFKDKELVNTIQWGLEGVHYVVDDAEQNLIKFPEGIDATTSGFYSPYGVYGDTRMCYIWDLSTSPAILEEFSAKAVANPTKGVGFCYDASNMTTQIMAISNVIAEYQAALCTGTADIDTAYPEFIAKLKQNGIDEIIADKQAQFDAWRSAN